jgi:hypothetical protein
MIFFGNLPEISQNRLSREKRLPFSEFFRYNNMAVSEYPQAASVKITAAPGGSICPQ